MSETTPNSQQAPVSIETAEVNGAEIHDVIYNQLMPALDGTPVPLAVLAMLAFSAIILRPNIPIEELKLAVQNTSEYLSFAISPAPKGAVN